MAKETFYFSHDYNSRSDKEMMKVRMKMGMVGIGLYWCIVEMLYEEGGYLNRSEYERISFELQSKNEDVTLLIEGFNLFKFDAEKFWSNAVLERLKIRKEKSEKARESINYRWSNTTVKRSKNDSNTNKGKKSKIKEKRGVSFSADGSKVFFDDNSSQELGLGQQQRYREGNYQPHYIIKDRIE